MTIEKFIKAWPILKRQVKSLRVPYLETFASRRRDPFQILISCILSLRTQDKTTEAASERLFKLSDTPEAMSRLSPKTIEKAIYPVGFYRVKARQIKIISRDISEKYRSRVPDTIEELLTLKGVGRKTANLVITVGYNKYGICVDTHVHRITNRWGLIKTKNPNDTELRLRETLPRRYWRELNGILVAFGQGVCKPISPYCSACKINIFCDKLDVERSR